MYWCFKQVTANQGPEDERQAPVANGERTSEDEGQVEEGGQEGQGDKMEQHEVPAGGEGAGNQWELTNPEAHEGNDQGEEGENFWFEVHIFCHILY